MREQDGTLLAVVERKTLENFAATLSDGTLAFQMQRLLELPLAAVVVEGRYPGLYKLEHVSGAWLAGPALPPRGALPGGSRRLRRLPGFAEEWTFRFLSSALSDWTGSTG